MDVSTLAYALPLAYAGLQFEAFTRMTGQWKTLALMPVGILVACLLAQFYAAPFLPELAAQLPLFGLGVSVAYLLGLFAGHWAAAPAYYDEIDEPEDLHFDNVLWLDAYRGVAAVAR